MSEAEIRNRIKEAMDRAVAENETPGCTFCFLKGGEEKIYLESGYANIEAEKPIARNSIYRMYSMTKPVTATTFLKLIEDGYADLYDPVSRYIDTFREQKYVTPDGKTVPVPAGRPMLLRDLLSMTSGLVYPDPATLPGQEMGTIFEDAIARLDTDHPMTTQEFALETGKCTLLFAPGEGWNYGVSADILGAVIEKITGMSFSDYMKEAVLDPVGMTDTDFYVHEDNKERLVTAYQNRDSQPGAPLVPYNGCNLAIRNDGRRNPFEAGGAGLFSTLDDYILFTGMLLNGGLAANGKRVLRSGTVRYLTTGRLSAKQQTYLDTWVGLEGFSYANLNRVLLDPRRAGLIGHAGEYGWDGWLGVYFSNDPDYNQTMLLMMNKTDYGTGRLTRQLHNIVFSAE